MVSSTLDDEQANVSDGVRERGSFFRVSFVWRVSRSPIRVYRFALSRKSLFCCNLEWFTLLYQSKARGFCVAWFCSSWLRTVSRNTLVTASWFARQTSSNRRVSRTWKLVVICAQADRTNWHMPRDKYRLAMVVFGWDIRCHVTANHSGTSCNPGIMMFILVIVSA